MNTQVQTSGLDTVKLTTALLLLLGGVVAFYWFANESLLVRVLGMLAVAGLSLFIASQTEKGRAAFGFMASTRTEVRKVIWPTRAETMQTAMIVFFIVMLMGVVLWLLDMFLLTAIRFLTGQGS